MLRLIIITVIHGWHCVAICQQGPTTIGARVAGMGNVGTMSNDGWSLFSNPSGISEITITEAKFTYEVTPGFPSFNRRAAVGVVPFHYGVVAAGLFRFGDDLYSEQMISAGYANTFGLASLGITTNFVQYGIKDHGSKYILAFNFGGQAKLTSWLTVGAYVQNINQAKLEAHQYAPTRMMLGVGMNLSPTCIIVTEIEKDIDFDPTWKGGFEYQLLKKFKVRSGVNLFPNAVFAGLGFKKNRSRMDYAFSHSQFLGARHQASVCYQFKKR